MYFLFMLIINPQPLKVKAAQAKKTYKSINRPEVVSRVHFTMSFICAGLTLTQNKVIEKMQPSIFFPTTPAPLPTLWLQTTLMGMSAN